MKKTLLAYRDYSGVGDWIMAMSVLKMVNQQFPDIDIYINLFARNRYASTNAPIMLPHLVQEIIKDFDVNIKGVVCYKNPSLLNYSKQYNYVSGHMVYRDRNLHYIKGMVSEFKKNIGLDLKYDKEVFAQYKKEEGNYDNTLDNLKPYILIQSCTKERSREKQGKDYGFNNMMKISRILSQSIRVIQIGQGTDLRIPKVHRFLDVDLSLLHKLMLNSVCFVGMDGALGVYASHHNVKQYIIYESEIKFNGTPFSARIQLDGNNMDAEEIAENIAEDINEQSLIHN